MKVFITDGERYMMKNVAGRYVAIPGIDMADEFNLREAQGLLKHKLRKYKKTFKVVPVNQLKNDTLVYLNNTVKAIQNTNILYWVEQVRTMHEYQDEVSNRYEVLKEQLSLIDKEKNDLEHFIEFNNLNACKGFRKYKELQQILIKRRNIKDEMKVLLALLNGDCKLSFEDIINVVKRLDSRVYTPRVKVD